MTETDTCVRVSEGELEAQQVRGFLEAHGVPCVFRGEALRKTHGLTLNGLGLVEVHVPTEFLAQARELLERADAGELALEPDGSAGDAGRE